MESVSNTKSISVFKLTVSYNKIYYSINNNYFIIAFYISVHNTLVYLINIYQDHQIWQDLDLDQILKKLDQLRPNNYPLEMDYILVIIQKYISAYCQIVRQY